jgi:peptidoglycan/LPS O-acetylase OafA/YrhL
MWEWRRRIHARLEDGGVRIVRPDERVTTVDKVPGPSFRWRGLDGLRAFAVLLVLACHFGFHAQGGIVGVDVFFVISGFLITSLLLKERDKTGKISFRDFWVRRAYRLFPALVCAIVFAVIMSRWALPAERHQTLIGVPPVLLYVGNWWAVFGPGHSLGLLSPDWSLAVEEQFYVVWPLVAALWLARTANRPRAALIIGILAVLDVGWLAITSLVLHYNNVYMRTDTHAMGLLAGSALALLLTQRKAITISPRLAKAAQAFALLGVLVIVGITLVMHQTPKSEAIAITTGTAAAVVLLVGLLLVPNGWLTNLFELRVAKWIGVRSYGIYLFNYPISVILLAHLHTHNTTRLALSLLGIMVSIGIAAASFKWVEQPFLARKARYSAAKTASLVAA